MLPLTNKIKRDMMIYMTMTPYIRINALCFCQTQLALELSFSKKKTCTCTYIYFRHTEKVKRKGKKNLYIDQEPTQEMFQQTRNGSKVGKQLKCAKHLSHV